MLDAVAAIEVGAGGEEITIYKSMGHAMEGVVTAALAYQAALAEGVGTHFVMTHRL